MMSKGDVWKPMYRKARYISEAEGAVKMEDARQKREADPRPEQITPAEFIQRGMAAEVAAGCCSVLMPDSICGSSRLLRVISVQPGWNERVWNIEVKDGRVLHYSTFKMTVAWRGDRA
jgi:hypothetical protein